jgi:hypothetical protein
MTKPQVDFAACAPGSSGTSVNGVVAELAVEVYFLILTASPLIAVAAFAEPPQVTLCIKRSRVPGFHVNVSSSVFGVPDVLAENAGVWYTNGISVS